MSREDLDRWCERGILGLVLAILIFAPLATGAVRVSDFLVLQGLTIGVLLLWAIRLWVKPRPQILWPPICWMVVAFTVYAVIRYFTSDLEYIARGELIRVLTYAYLFLAIVNNLHRQEHTQLIIFVLIFLAMAIAGYAIYQFATGSNRVWNFITPYEKRGTGTFISPNNLAGFLEMVLPLGLATLLVSRATAVLKIFVAYASLVILGGIAVSLSRGGWVATAAAMLGLFSVLLLHRRYRLPAALLLIALVGVGIWFVPKAGFIKARIQQTTAHNRLQDSARFDLWEPAIRLWEENPWWGIGPNHYNFRYRAYRLQSEQGQPDRAHNDYLNTLADWGIAGAALVLGAVILLYAGVWKTWRFVRGTAADLGSANSNKFALVLGGSFAVAAILVHSFVDFNMHIPANAILAIALMALVTSTLRFATEAYWHGVRTGLRLTFTGLLILGIGFLALSALRAAREQVWLVRAARFPPH
jgi:O-antigen ligase